MSPPMEQQSALRNRARGRGALWEAETPVRRGSGTGAWEAAAVRSRRRQHDTPGQAAAPSQAPLLGKRPEPKVHVFRVGELVERRDQDEEWKRGYVTSVFPLEVTVNAERGAAGYAWDEVRPVEWQPEPQAPPKANGSTVASPLQPSAVRPESPTSLAQSLRPARLGSEAEDKGALASKEVQHDAPRQIKGFSSKQVTTRTTHAAPQTKKTHVHAH